MLLQALDLILSLINASRPGICGALLNEQPKEVIQCLKGKGYLLRSGVSQFYRESHNRISRLIWSSEHREFRYFSSVDGWVSVPTENVQLYHLNYALFLDWLSRLFDINPIYKVSQLENNLCWSLGPARVDRCWFQVYFARRVDQAEESERVFQCLQNESREPSLVVLPKPAVMTSHYPLSVRLIPIHRLLVRRTDCVELNQSMMSSIVSGIPQQSRELGGFAFRHSADFRTVEWLGVTYQLNKRQAIVVETLYKAGGRVHKDLLAAEARSNEPIRHIMRNRKDGRWIPHPLWNTLIQGDGEGYYWLAFEQ